MTVLGRGYIDVEREMAVPSEDPSAEEAVDLFRSMSERRLSADPEQRNFAAWCDRADNLYFPQGFTKGGASHWAGAPNANKPGTAHISDNVYPIYVDIPAALQSVEPVENMIANDVTDESRQYAAMAERLYFAWKREEDWEIKAHKAATVKGLYGRTAAKVYWDDDSDYPKVDIVDQPRNLYLGWRTSNYNSLEWALYTYAITPMGALEDWGLLVDAREDTEGVQHGVVVGSYSGDDVSWRARLVNAEITVEVYDYWYRRPAKGKRRVAGKPVRFETWNAIFVGNALVKNKRHAEYAGKLPYVPVFNTFIPGEAKGRPDFWDIEQFIREKDEKLSEASQLMSRAIKGQMWQVRGPNVATRGNSIDPPKPNKVHSSGPDNWIEAIEPWMPSFQLETYLDRMNMELTDSSGLNDLLKGQAPTQVLSSGKAITALTANYEMRLRLKRAIFYMWRVEVWNLAAQIWVSKNEKLKPVLGDGVASLDLTPPSLMPRDDLETATMAGQLMQQRLWSQERAMDHVGVDDPEVEKDMIRSERTDAALFPADVQIIASLTATLTQLQQQQAQVQAGIEAAREPQAGLGAGPLLGGANPEAGLASQRAQGAPQGTPSLNGPGEVAPTGPEQQPTNADTGPGGRSSLQSQSLIQNGEVSPRIVQSADIQRESGA